MSQDVEKYERLVALAGWLWMRVRDNRPYFRRSDLALVEGLAHLGADGAAGRKAFERATEELESFGIAIEWNNTTARDADPNIAGAYRVSGLKLTPEQQSALLDLAFTIAYRDLATEAAIRIPGSFLEGAGDALLLEANRHVSPIAEAIHNRKCIRFSYLNTAELREVQPVRLGYKRGNWYLAAYEFASDTMKVYRLDRMNPPESSDERWSDVHSAEEGRVAIARVDQRFFWGGGEVKQVVLAVDEDAELSARRLLPDLEEIGEDDRDRLLLTREYANEENMLDAVLTLGRRAEILEPPELRSAMIAHLSAMIGDGA